MEARTSSGVSGSPSASQSISSEISDGTSSASGPALADPVSRAYYDRKRAEGKRHNAALICLARRRCDVLYAMLRDKIPYQPRPTTPIAA